MILFQCDYNEGAHPKVMEKLMETNLEQTVGYGEDEHCAHAADLIRKACGDDSLAVHFLVGGTQANMTVIAAALRPHQGVIAAQTGHINGHETGAVEATGHKVLALPQKDGKISASQVKDLCEAHLNDASFEHTVQPKMVYISNPTEYGTLYTRKELEALHEVCRRYGLYLFLDGARLGYGLAAADNELDLPMIAACCDVFYIGGTKVGALFGEAVVMSNDELKKDFRYLIKQKGGMLAKGRLLGVQFEALFEDGLYLEISRHADRLADKLREAFTQAGFPFLVENQTNQIFPVIPDHILEKLGEKYGFNYQERVDETHSAVRFCTSWATTEENTGVGMAMEDILVQIGKRLCKRRKEMGLTQEAMAERLGMSLTFYGGIERGRKRLSIEKILLVYEQTGMDPDYLLTGKGPLDQAVMEIFKSCPEEKRPVLEQILSNLTELCR